MWDHRNLYSPPENECMNCGNSSEFVEDLKQAEIMCAECGLVVATSSYYIRDAPFKEYERCGGEDHTLGASTCYQTGRGESCSSSTLFKLNKICNPMSTVEKDTIEKRNLIDTIFSRLCCDSEQARGIALSMWTYIRDTSAGTVLRNQEHLVYCCVFYGHRYYYNNTFYCREQFCYITLIQLTDFLKAEKEFRKKLEHHNAFKSCLNFTDAGSLIPGIVNKLCITHPIIKMGMMKETKTIKDDLDKYELLETQKPNTMATAIVVIALVRTTMRNGEDASQQDCLNMLKRITIEDIEKLNEVSKGTIRRAFINIVSKLPQYGHARGFFSTNKRKRT